MTRLSAIDLFAGVGGMSLGIEAAGFDVVCAVEFDPIHCLTHEFNFPDTVSICQDIRMVTGKDIRAILASKGISDLDLIVGGPPCQGFSHIGQRQLEDPRNSLVLEFCRIIGEIKPKYFIFENVPGIATGNHKVFVDELMRTFSENGYKLVGPKILNAAEYGVPQARKRFILMGHRPDVMPPTFPLASHSIEASGNLLGRKPLVTACEAIGDLEDIEPYTETDLGIASSRLLYTGYREQLAPGGGFAYRLCNIRGAVASNVFGHVGSKHTEASREKFAHTIPGTIEKTSRFFKLHPNQPCNTIRAGTASDRGAFTAPRPIHYSNPRCITVREAARLHSYPDWFRFHSTIWHGFRQIGNSLPPLFASALGDAIRNALGVEPEDIEILTLATGSIEHTSHNMSDACRYYNVASPIPQRSRCNGKI